MARSPIPTAQRWTPPPARVEGERILKMQQMRQQTSDAKREAVEAEARADTAVKEANEAGRQVDQLREDIKKLRADLPKIVDHNSGGGGRRTVKKVLERDYGVVPGQIGTVSSVAMTVPTGFSVAGSPITSSGTLALTFAAGYQGYTSAEAGKLSGVATGATANDTNANLRSRATHTGTQTASTISDFSTAADARISAAIGSTVQAYSAQLAALAALNTTGHVVRTAANTFVTRTITGTASQITVTNGNGVSGNPTLALDNAVTTSLGKADTALQSSAIGVSVQSYDAATAKLNVEDQTITGGARVTSKSLGTITTGTVTPDPGDRPLQHYTNDGAHTLAPGANGGSYLLDITNGASAGAITTSGWTKVVGDSFTTTNGHKFRCHCSIGAIGSLLVVQAFQ